MPRSTDEIDQMRKVLLFREEIKGQALVWEYDSPEKFAEAIRKHRCLRITRLIEEQRRRRVPKARPDDASIDNLRALWDQMTPELQQAFSVAYNENRRAGDPGIQTRDLFLRCGGWLESN